MTYYNSTDTCDRIKNDGNRCGNNFYGKAIREKDKKGNLTGRYICNQCYQLIYNWGTTDKDKISQIRSEYFKKKSDKYYNRTNTCDSCRGKFEDIKGHPGREYNKDRNLTGRWLCSHCWDKNHQKNRNDNRTKGDLSEAVTCNVRKIKDLNIESDNYNSPIDHSRDPELGIIDSLGRFYDPIRKRYGFGNIDRYNNKVDYIIIYCISEDGKIIERVYIIPIYEIMQRASIYIYNNISDHWYDKYRINEKPYNDAYQSLLLYLSNKKYFGIEDIKKWLEFENGSI